VILLPHRMINGEALAIRQRREANARIEKSRGGKSAKTCWPAPTVLAIDTLPIVYLW
jgi:hypothetical protein